VVKNTDKIEVIDELNNKTYLISSKDEIIFHPEHPEYPLVVINLKNEFNVANKKLTTIIFKKGGETFFLFDKTVPKPNTENDVIVNSLSDINNLCEKMVFAKVEGNLIFSMYGRNTYLYTIFNRERLIEMRNTINKLLI
jgi:hypothetical protein